MRIRRLLASAVPGVLLVFLAACTAHGGGRLAPAEGFAGPATFGLSVSCERSSGSTNPNAPAGRLRVRLSYVDHGRNPLGSAFGIQGEADELDPVQESMFCIGQNPPPGGNELIVLGRYRLTKPAPAGFPSRCPTRETSAAPLCRFEVLVRDNGGTRGGPDADYFSIKLSTETSLSSELPPESVFYQRAGFVDGGSITVD